MNRWMMGVLAAGVVLLLYPPPGQAQKIENIKCEFNDTGSTATVENNTTEKTSASCSWACLYQLTTGGTHTNQGSAKLDYGEKKTTVSEVKNIQRVMAFGGKCLPDPKDMSVILCGFNPTSSTVHIINMNAANKPSNCRWKCVYQLKNGKLHVNSGAKRVAPGRTARVMEGASGIVSKVSEAGSCAPL